MSKYTWKKVEWDNSGELIRLLMSGKEIYLYRNSSDFAWYNGGRTNESPFRFGNLDLNFGYTYSGIGYIRKEVDWTDVVSEERPIFCRLGGKKKIVLISKKSETGGYFKVKGENTFFNAVTPATLKELEPMIWECMQDD